MSVQGVQVVLQNLSSVAFQAITARMGWLRVPIFPGVPVFIMLSSSPLYMIGVPGNKYVNTVKACTKLALNLEANLSVFSSPAYEVNQTIVFIYFL